MNRLGLARAMNGQKGPNIMELSDKKPVPLPYIRDPRRGSHGCIMTASDLPQSDGRRWSPSLKAIVAQAIKRGVITMDEAAARYHTDARELGRWIALLDQHGVGGLRADRFELDESAARKTDELGAVQEGPVTIDFAAKLVRISGEIVALTPVEMRILAMLIRRTPYMVGREEMFAMLYEGRRPAMPKILDIMICKIRRKLQCNGAIETIWGRGWRWKGIQ
jgi:transposase-like protein